MGYRVVQRIHIENDVAASYPLDLLAELAFFAPPRSLPYLSSTPLPPLSLSPYPRRFLKPFSIHLLIIGAELAGLDDPPPVLLLSIPLDSRAQPLFK